MSLSNEAKEALTKHYEELAEEFWICYRSLKLQGFDAAQSMDIMLALMSNPTSSATKREAIEKNRTLIRERLERHPKPDFTNHDGSHDYD